MERPPGVDPFMRPSPPPVQTPSNRNCVTCGRAIDWQSNVCPYCGHDYRVAMGPPPKPRTSKPIVAGVIILLAGLFALGQGMFLMMADNAYMEGIDLTAFEDEGYSVDEIRDLLTACGAIDILFGVIAIIGGAIAFTRKHYMLAMIGAVFAILGFGFVIGSIFGLIGIILLVMSKQEFE